MKTQTPAAIALAILISGCATGSKDSVKPNGVSDADKYPFLTRPEVSVIVVPDTIEGDKYIESHRVFILKKNSSWSKDHDR